MFIRFIIYLLISYFIIKIFKIIVGYFKGGSSNNNAEYVSRKSSSHMKINKEDIIEAEFEEIKDEEENITQDK
jgi:hypothetical protein